MRAVPGRVVCPRCGENNFDTQANCWKCGSALAGTSPSPPATPRAGSSPSAASAAPAVVPIPLAAGRSLDPAVAVWSAIALAFLFPAVAVPAGLLFLMLDDRRKAELGRILLTWGVVFSLLHLLVTAWWLRGMYEEVRPFLPGSPASARLPRLNDSVPPIQVPSEQQNLPEVPFPEPPAPK